MYIPASALTGYSDLFRQRNGSPGSEYPVIARTGVSVHRIGFLWRRGNTPEAIIEDHFPELHLSEVFAALSCFLANEQVFVDADDEDGREADRILAQPTARAQ